MRYFWILAPLLLSAACQSDSASRLSLYANCYVRYMEDNAQIRAEASFYQGDSLETAQPLWLEGGVSFLGSGMETRDVEGKLFRYQYQNAGEFPEKASFSYAWNGRDQSFSLAMAAPAPASWPDTLSRQKGYSLPAPGPNLSADERLILIFTDAANQTTSLEWQGPLPAEGWPLPADKLAALAPGPCQIDLVKKKIKKFSEKPAEVYFTLEFYAKSTKTVIF